MCPKYLCYDFSITIVFNTFQISAYYTLYNSDFKDVKKPQESEPVYAVIIDAGSTGSRVLALAFKRTPSKQHF